MDLESLLKQRSWVKFLKERALEAVINIQRTNQSDSSEIKSANQNGHLNGDSQDDAKWMETVLLKNDNNKIRIFGVIFSDI